MDYFCNNLEIITNFINRLSKIGIKVELFANYPWIYLDRINGKKVVEKQFSEYGFTIFMYPVRIDRKVFMIDSENTFKLIRKYNEEI